MYATTIRYQRAHVYPLYMLPHACVSNVIESTWRRGDHSIVIYTIIQASAGRVHINASLFILAGSSSGIGGKKYRPRTARHGVETD